MTTKEFLQANDKRLKDAITNATDAFWTSIAESFPEAKAGDMDIAEAVRFEDRCMDAATTWLRWNHPDIKD